MIGVQKEVSLKPYNTFRVDVPARFFAEITSVEELEELLGNSSFKTEKVLVVGKGANVLFSKPFNGLVLKMAIEGISVVNENDETVVLKVGAGHDWSDFVAYAVENNWRGVENMAGIPGTVGGAVVGNAGAYGVETSDCLASVEVFALEDSSVKSIKKGVCGFAYRDSNFKSEFKGKYIIISATFVLNKKPAVSLADTKYQSVKADLEKLGKSKLCIKDVFDTVTRIRAEKLPDISKVGSAGSVFENPIVNQKKLDNLLAKYPDMPHFDVTAGKDKGKHKLAVGWMLDQLGWKNKRIGNVSTMPNHANIVFTDGNATGSEVLSFVNGMQADCKKSFGINIKPEILIV